MIKYADIFRTDKNQRLDFTKGKVDIVDVFNNGILKVANKGQEFDSTYGFGSITQSPTAKDRLLAALDTGLQSAVKASQSFNDFAGMPRPPQSNSLYETSQAPASQAPITPPPAASTAKNTQGFTMFGNNVKMANYGYDSDHSPDYNSNVLRIGNRNNKLVDGTSAAITSSLAKRYGLKPGDRFQALSSTGKVYERTYDDTVPSTYQGRPLPETIDFYERGGSNNFGGKLTGIKILSR